MSKNSQKSALLILLLATQFSDGCVCSIGSIHRKSKNVFARWDMAAPKRNLLRRLQKPRDTFRKFDIVRSFFIRPENTRPRVWPPRSRRYSSPHKKLCMRLTPFIFASPIVWYLPANWGILSSQVENQALVCFPPSLSCCFRIPCAPSAMQPRRLRSSPDGTFTDARERGKWCRVGDETSAFFLRKRLF